MTSRSEPIEFCGRLESQVLSTWMLIFLCLAGMAACTVGQQTSTQELAASSLTGTAVTTVSEQLNSSDVGAITSTQAEGKYDRVLPAVSMPTKLPTNQHAPSMGMLHPSSTLLAVLSAYHFKASYLSSDWPDSAIFASLQPMTAVLSKVSNLHALLGFGTVSKTFVHETVEQLIALQTALSSSFQRDSHLTTLRHDSYLITSRMPSIPMNCPITSRLLSSPIKCPIRAAIANLHSSSQPIRTPVNIQTCLTPYSNITNLKPISSFFIHTNTRQQKIAQGTQFSPRGPSLSCSSGFEYEFTNVSLGDNLTFSVFDPLTILSSEACCTCTSLSGSVNICFALTANGMTMRFTCSSTQWCVCCILYSSKYYSVFNLTNISLVSVPSCLLYSNHPRINEPFASVYSKTSLFLIDPLHQNLSFVEENGCVIGNSILSLQTLQAGEVMMVTPGPLLTIIAASMTKPDHSRSISVAILTPALLHTASESRGSGSSWLSSATTLQSYHSFDLSPPRSFGWPTATQSSQKLPQVLPSSPSRFPSLQIVYVCPVPLELTSHLNTNLLSNFSSGQSVTSFPVSMSSFGMTLSFGFTVGKNSSLLPDLSPVFKLMKILEGTLKILSFPYEVGLEAMFLRTSVPLFWFIFEQGVLFPFDWVIKNPSPDLTNVFLSVFIYKTHNFIKDNASPDTVLHHIHTCSGIITPNFSVDNPNTTLQISAVHAGIAKSTTSCTLTVPSFEKSVVGLLMPSHTSRSRLPGLLFQSPDPIQTFHLPSSPLSALSLFSQSPCHYLPASVSMATQAIDAWEIIYYVLSVFNTSGPLIEANQFYDRVVMDLRVLLSHKVNISGYFTKPFTSNLLYFFSIFFLLRLHSPGSSFPKLSSLSHMLFPSLSLLSLSFLSIPILSFLPVTSGLSSFYFKISTPNSLTASLKAMNSTLVPTSPSMSFPSPSTSSISPNHHTDSFHAPISTLASPGVNDSHESHGLPEITSVIATPSRSYPDGNSSSLSASAYASISPVSTQHRNHSAEVSLHPSMRDPSLLSLPISRLSLGSPGSAVHETISLHLTSASPVPSSRRDTMNNLLQLSDISMSTPQALLSIITPTASSHTSSATLRAYFTSVISVSDPLSSGLVTPSLPSSFANAFPTSFMNVESQLSFSLHASSKLNSPLHPLNADYTSSFVTMIQHTSLSSLLMRSFLSDAHMSSTSHFQISHSFQHMSKESATTPWLMHPSFTRPDGLSFAASSKETLHSSLPSSHATVSSSYSALRSSHSALQSYSYSPLLYLPFTYSSLSSSHPHLSLHSPLSSLNSPSSSLNSPLPSSHSLLPLSHPRIPSSPSTLPSSHSHFTLLSPLPSSRLILPSLHSHLQSSHLHLPSSPSTLLPSHSPLTSLHSLLSSLHSPLSSSHSYLQSSYSHLQSSHSLFPSWHSPLSSIQHLPSSLSSLPRDLSLVSFMPPIISSSPHNSHPPHPSQTAILDRITPVTTSPLSFLPNIGSVTTSSPSLVSASLPSRLPSNETESVITMATRMLTSTSTSLINPPSLDISLESTAIMNSINTSEALSSMTSSPLSTFSKLDVVSPSTLLETVLFTQTSFDFVTPVTASTRFDSVEVDLTTDHSSFIRMIDSTAMIYPTLTPSFVTPSFDGSSLVPQEPSFSTLTPTKYLTSVYDSYTLISTPYSVESLTIVSTLTQYYDSVTPVPSNIYTMESIGSNFSHPGRLTPVPSTPTQTPYTTTSEHETMLPTQIYPYSTPFSQVLIQTPTPSLSSWMNISSSLQPSSVSLMHSMPDTLLTPSVSDTTSLQTTFPSSFLDSTPLLISSMTDYVIMSSGVTITSMPIDVSIETSSSVNMPDVLHSDSVDTLSSTDGILTSTSLPLSTATASLVHLQTSTPESSMLSPMTSKELSNTSTEGSQTLHSFSTSERMSAIVQTPILSSSVQSMSSVQANESMPSLSLFTNLSTLQEDPSSTYAIMPSDVISQTMMQTIITSFVNSSQSEIMPSPSIYIPMQSSVFNSTMHSSLMDSLLGSVANQTGTLPMQASTAVVGSDHVSSTLASSSNMSSVSMLPMPSAGQMTMVTSVAMESSTPLVNKSDSLFPTSSSGFDSVSSSIVAMATEMPLSSSGMILPTPNSTISSDFPGFNSTLPTPSLPFMPLSSSSLPPNSTLHSGAPATPIFSSLSPVTSILSTPSMSLVSSSILETRSNSSSSTTTVSVEILSTPLVSLSTPSASVSVSSVFVPTSPTSQTNLSTTDTTPVVVSTTNQSLSAEPTTVVMNTSSVTPPTSSPNADNVTVSPQTTGAVVSLETSSMTPGVSTFLNYTMTTTPATNVTTSSPGTTSTPTTPVTTPMDTTEATTPEATVPPTTSTTIPPTTHVETTTPTVVTTNQDVTNSSTEPRTTQTRTPTPFDTSFATKPYWLTMGLAIDENINVNAPSYVEEMEGNLADMYVEANRRSNQRMVEVEQLLDQLDPERNPAVDPGGARRRRAVTVDTITAQIIDMTRLTDPTHVDLTFYIVEEGTKLLSGEAKAVLDELTLQEMTLYMAVPVNSPPIEVVPSTTVMPSAEPPARLWIIAAVLVPLALLFFCCLCCCCCCCGRKPRKEDGPMDPDTFKMLQFKAKYPYRQYPGSPQDQHLQPVPRGFDVVKQDYANNAFGMEAGAVEGKQQIEEEAEMMIQRELPRRTVEGHVSPVLHTRNQYPIGQSPTPSGTSSSSLVPPLPVKQTKSHQRVRDGSTSGSDTGEELYKQRREYMAAQEEINRVLEPELYSSQGRKSHKGKAGGKKGGVQKTKDRKAEGEKSVKNKLKKMESLPDNHYARAGVGAQDEVDIQPEPLQETKQKMHALIDEAFSLVGKGSPSKNAVVPLSGGLSNSQNHSSREEGKKTPRDGQQEVPRQLFAPVIPPIPRRKPKDTLIDGGTQTSEMGQTTRVVVVPVSKPPQEGSSVIWNPYTAGDETARLSPSLEPASLPGGLNASPIPSPRGVSSTHQQNLVSSRERRPDGDSLRGTKQGVVERYADMLQEMLTSQLPLPPEEGDDLPSKSSHKRGVALLEGEPDYDWSFDRSINGSQRSGSKTRSPLPNRTKSNESEKGSASTSVDDQLPSLSKKEKGVGKAVDKFYDELDVSTNLKYPTGQYSPQVANAVREELIRLTRRMGDGEESGLV